MAVTSADLLAASLPPRLTFSPTNQSAAPAADDSGTPAAADFQNVLSSLRTATPTDTSANPNTPVTDAAVSTTDDKALPDDLLTALLAETDDTAADATTDPNTALSLLLAAVTANPTVTAEVVPADVTASLTAATTLPTAVAAEPVVTPPTVPPVPAAVRTRADEIRLAQSPNRPTTTPLTTAQRTAPTVPATDATPAQATTPTPATPAVATTQLPAVPAATTTTAATPGDTPRAAARPLAILPQAAVVVDPTQALPGGPPSAATPPVFPPVAAADPVQPTPAVTPGQPLNVALELRANFSPPAAPVPTPEAAVASPFAAVLKQEAGTPAAVVAPAAPQTQAAASTPTTAAVTPAPQLPAAPAIVTTPQPIIAPTSQPAAAPTPAVAQATANPTPTDAVVVPNSQPVAAPVPTLQPAPVVAAAVEGRPPAETIVANAVNAVPLAPTSTRTPAASVRDSLLDSVPVDSSNKVDLTATNSTPVAGLVPQTVDARPTPAPAAATATPASPAAQLSDSIVSHASLAERDGKVEFQIRLDPAELGPVKIKVVAHGDRMSAEVVVSNDAVRKMVESQLPDLRQRLADAGLNVPTLDVSTGSDQQQNGRNADTGDWEQAFGGFRQVPSAGPSARRPAVRTATGGAGSLDVMV